MYDETDSVIDEHRERMAFARAEFVEPPNNFCELCLVECDGGICPRCDLWGDGLYDENRWTYDDRVPDA